MRPTLAIFFVSCGMASHPCEPCHAKQVRGYAQSGMALSLRHADKEPEGAFQHAASGTKFTVRRERDGMWQRLERGAEVSGYRVAYVIGSGNHARGYLLEVAGHLFQSPISYYTNRGAYDMAPGFERSREPDFTRPVTEECLLCHSGKPLPVRETLNQFQSPPFAEEGIGCERCHGAAGNHLKLPAPGSIVNPAKLPTAARDSVCEQCHLSGVVRVLNPGKTFGDFVPGQRLEEVYTVYTAPIRDGTKPFRVVSHSEQLALSECARKSQGKLWCGTCHDPHEKPTQPSKYYSARCRSCHQGRLARAHPVAANGDCLACHMPRRNPKDGGHAVFTDHRIARRLEPEQDAKAPEELSPWRKPPPESEQRNLALAYLNAGLQSHSPALLVSGYRMLTEVQATFADDPAVFQGLGNALLLAQQPGEAVYAFERLQKLRPDSSLAEQSLATAYLELGNAAKAAAHFERALELDPLLLPAAASLAGLYRQTGQTEKALALTERTRRAMSPGL